MSETKNNNSISEKRKRRISPDNHSNKPTGNTQKKNRKSTLSEKEMENIQRILAESLKGVSEQLNDVSNKLDDKITSLAEKVSEDVKKEIHTLRTSMDTFTSTMSTQITLIESKLNNHDNRLLNNEDDIERVSLLNQLRLTGIPFNENEKLSELFITLANHIEYPINESANIPTLKRIPMRKNGIITGSNTIIMYFLAKHQKENFYSAYLRKIPIKPTLWKLPDHIRIVIGENLTKKNASLFTFCNALKKENKIAQLFSSNGLICIKFKRGREEKTHIVRNKFDVELLCEQHNRLSNVITTGEPNITTIISDNIISEHNIELRNRDGSSESKERIDADKFQSKRSQIASTSKRNGSNTKIG